MSVLELGRVQVDPPEQFPISHLSVSSLNAYLRCPEQWMRERILKEASRPNGKMAAGGAAGAALSQHYGRIIEGGEGFSIEQLLDEFCKALAGRQEREDVDWSGDEPGQVKDTAIGALRVYHQHIAPDVRPLAVEREFELSWPDCPFVLTGYLDLEEADGAVGDVKLSGSRWGQAKADSELQPDIYMGARLAEGNPAPEFRYHTLIRGKTKQTAEIVHTQRSAHRLDMLTARVFSIARSIERRWLQDDWYGVGPDSTWMCRGCSHASTCAWSMA
jgi:hypothetical protein